MDNVKNVTMTFANDLPLDIYYHFIAKFELYYKFIIVFLCIYWYSSRNVCKKYSNTKYILKNIINECIIESDHDTTFKNDVINEWLSILIKIHSDTRLILNGCIANVTDSNTDINFAGLLFSKIILHKELIGQFVGVRFNQKQIILQFVDENKNTYNIDSVSRKIYSSLTDISINFDPLTSYIDFICSLELPYEIAQHQAIVNDLNFIVEFLTNYKLSIYSGVTHDLLYDLKSNLIKTIKILIVQHNSFVHLDD